MVARNVTKDARPAEPGVVTDVGRGIDLPPEAWHLAPRRQAAPLPRPTAVPFDLEQCLRRLGRVKANDYYHPEWGAVGIAPTLTPEEADFWLLAMAYWCEARAPQEFAAHLRGVTFTGRGAFPKFRESVRHPRRMPPPEAAVPLANLFGADLFLLALLDGEFRSTANLFYARGQAELALVRGAWEWVLPYMSEPEKDALRTEVRPRLNPGAWPKQYQDPLPVAYYLAAMLGMHDEVWELVRGWQFAPTDPARQVLLYYSPLLILLGLRDPAVAEAKARELGVPLNTRFDVRAWLAFAGVGGVDFAAQQIDRQRYGQRVLFDELARLKDPAAAWHVLALRVKGKTPDRARAWLDANVGSAVAGLLPLTPGRDRVAVAAVEYLRDVVKRGYGWVVEREAATADPQVARKVRRAVLDRPERAAPEFEPGTEPDWLRKQVAGWGGRNLVPAWLHPATLPPVLVGDFRLSAAHVAALVAELRHVTANHDDLFGAATPFADALRAHASASLDGFAVELFERWLAEKTPHADAWVLAAVGRLGGDAAVDVIVPRIRRWPGGMSSRRIKDALAAVRAIGTDYALAQLAGLATSHPSRRFRTFATEELAAAAAARGLTTDQLEDRTVPDLGLGRGGPVFSYGPREFRLAIGAGLKAVARDARGKPHAALPAPRKTDDAVLVVEAREAFRLAKSQAGEVVAAVCGRLERGLVHQRRWSADDFDRFLVRHPLTGAVTRRLVWGWFGVDGSLTGTFRVTDEGEFAGPDDRPAVANALQVGLVHPVQLAADERAAWAERLADYELVPPFPQLARPVFDLPDGDRGVTEVLRFAAKSVPWAAIQRTVRDHGWAAHGERYCRMFPAAGLTAVAQVTGWDRREVKGCVFMPGTDPNPGYDPTAALPLGHVPVVVRCEVFADLAAWARAAGPAG